MAYVWANRVRDTTASTGTGSITVSGVPPLNYQTWSTEFAVNDFFYYCIVHQTLQQWEVGLGQYLGASVFTRVNVLDGSSGAGTLVTFSAGTKDVFVTLPANWGARQVIQAATTYYVRSDGSDNNSGLANTAAGAWLTLQRAMDFITQELDTGGLAITVQAGTVTTWAAGILTTAGWTGGGSVILDLNGGTISTTGTCIEIGAASGNVFRVQNGTLTSTSGYCLNTSAPNSWIDVGASVTFGTCGVYHLAVNAPGSLIRTTANYTINGNAIVHMNAINRGGIIIQNNPTVTLSGTPGFTFFAFADRNATVVCNGATYSGSATGQRYFANANGVIYTGGQSATFLPGNSDGYTNLGGVYA